MHSTILVLLVANIFLPFAQGAPTCYQENEETNVCRRTSSATGNGPPGAATAEVATVGGGGEQGLMKVKRREMGMADTGDVVVRSGTAAPLEARKFGCGGEQGLMQCT